MKITIKGDFSYSLLKTEKFNFNLGIASFIHHTMEFDEEFDLIDSNFDYKDIINPFIEFNNMNKKSNISFYNRIYVYPNIKVEVGLIAY